MYPQDTLPSEQIINADKQILSNTDYNMLKAFEYILKADSLDELLFCIRYVREKYSGPLELRKTCRDEINEAEITLVQEQNERDKEIAIAMQFERDNPGVMEYLDQNDESIVLGD